MNTKLKLKAQKKFRERITPKDRIPGKLVTSDNNIISKDNTNSSTSNTNQYISQINWNTDSKKKQLQDLLEVEEYKAKKLQEYQILMQKYIKIFKSKYLLLIKFYVISFLDTYKSYGRNELEMLEIQIKHAIDLNIP